MENTHPSILLMLSIIMIIAIIIGGFYFGLVPALVGNIIAEAGNTTRLDINVNKATIVWGGVYGLFSTTPSDNNFTAMGGSIINENLSVTNPAEYLNPEKNVYASYQSTINSSVLVPALPSELDSFLGLPADDIRSASSTFTNMTNFTIGKNNYSLYSTFTNSPAQSFDVGLLKDTNSGNFFFVSHVIPGGSAYNGVSADFQLMLPVPNGSLNYSFFLETSSCSLNVLLVQGENWFSLPCVVSNNSIAQMLSSLGEGAGTGHDTPGWSGMFPTCTGNASDNFAGNYTIVWSYNESNPSPWKNYNPNKFCFQINDQDLKRIERENNYQISINATSELLKTSGSLAPNTPIDLITGENWIGFPSTRQQNLQEALASLGSGAGLGHDTPGWSGMFPTCTGNASDNFVGNYSILWTYNASDSSPWKSYNPNKFCFEVYDQGIKKMRPGSGYQITATVPEILVISG